MYSMIYLCYITSYILYLFDLQGEAILVDVPLNSTNINIEVVADSYGSIGNRPIHNQL